VPGQLAVQPTRELPDAVSLGHPSSVTGGCDSGPRQTWGLEVVAPLRLWVR
jgi:hypothetical protein